MNLKRYRRVTDLERHILALITKTHDRRVYEDLLAAKADAAARGDAAAFASAERELNRYVEEPPPVSHEELLEFHTRKVTELRNLVHDFGPDDFGEYLDEAEAQLAELMATAAARRA